MATMVSREHVRQMFQNFMVDSKTDIIMSSFSNAQYPFHEQKRIVFGTTEIVGNGTLLRTERFFISSENRSVHNAISIDIPKMDFENRPYESNLVVVDSSDAKFSKDSNPVSEYANMLSMIWGEFESQVKDFDQVARYSIREDSTEGISALIMDGVVCAIVIKTAVKGPQEDSDPQDEWVSVRTTTLFNKSQLLAFSRFLESVAREESGDDYAS